MKIASTTKKIVIALFSMGSVVVTAGSFADRQFYSTAFMDETRVESAKRLDDNGRHVSSVVIADNSPAVLEIEMTEENIKRINGVWNIYNIVGDEEKINFNAKFELIGKGLVKIGGEQIYKISFLSDQNTIALFKEMGKVDGEEKYEIIEARKIESETQMKEIVAEQKVMAQEGLSINSKEIDLNINSTGTKLSGKYTGKSATGSIRISNGQILNFDLSLNGEHVLSFDEAVEIGDGGAFIAQANIGQSTETISGIIINSGKDSYTLRLATGEYQGATIVFDSTSEYDQGANQQVVDAPAELPPSEQAVPVEQERVEQAQQEAAQIQENIQNERKALMDAMDAQIAEKPPVQELTDEQKEEISQRGFSFSNN